MMLFMVVSTGSTVRCGPPSLLIATLHPSLTFINKKKTVTRKLPMKSLMARLVARPFRFIHSGALKKRRTILQVLAPV